MRADHHAFQRATRVASLGLFVQLAMGLTLLVFGEVTNDLAFRFGSWYVLAGVIVWLTLVIVFHQHRLERIEAMEIEEIASTRRGGEGVFDERSEIRVAARRLALMHRWLAPIVSLLLAALLGLLSYLIWHYFDSVRLARLGEPIDVQTFTVTTSPGWGLAITIGLALASFIFSRFVAGMAKLEAWGNLRGGAGTMVGAALVNLALAVGIGFQFGQKAGVHEWIAWLLMPFMAVLAAEIVIRFILGLYRPRRPGEIPKAAFDSWILSLLTAPDLLVRTINEGINYQFGFDITSSWGYQLVLRSFAWLALFAVGVAMLLSCVVIVEPGQQAVRLRGGRLIGDVATAGMMFKLPWPIESARIFDVGRIRELPLLDQKMPHRDVIIWSDDPSNGADRQYFLVGQSRLADQLGDFDIVAPIDDPAGPINPISPINQINQANQINQVNQVNQIMGPGTSTADATVGRDFALVDAEIVLQYRVRDDALLDYLNFANEARTRRSPYDGRERALRSIALREVTSYLSSLPLEEALSPGRSQMLNGLRTRIQEAFDRQPNVPGRHGTGVEVVAVTIPVLRPPASPAGAFEGLNVEIHARREQIEVAEASVAQTMATLVSDGETGDRIVAEIDRYNGLRRAAGGVETAESLELRSTIEREMIAAQVQAGSSIESAAAERWKRQLEARSQAVRVSGELSGFLIAPRLFMQRQIMKVLSEQGRGARAKYVLGIDPERVRVELKMMEADPTLNAFDAIETKDEPDQ